MKARLSLAYPVIGLVALTALSTTLALYSISVRALRQAIAAGNMARAENVYDVVEAVIDKKASKLSALSMALSSHREITDAIEYFYDSQSIEPLKKIIDRMYPGLDLDVFQVTDNQERVLYRAHSPQDRGDKPNIWGVAEALAGKQVVVTSNDPQGWAFRAVVPACKDDRILGSIMIGYRINDTFAERLAVASDTKIWIGSLNGMIAQSHSLAASWSDQLPETEKIMLRSLKENQVFYQELKRHNRYFKRLKIGDAMFCLVVEVDTSKSVSQFTQTKKRIAATASFILLLVLLFGGLLSARLIRPLRQLQHKTQGMVEQITGDKLEAPGQNEILSLVVAFDAMNESVLSHIASRRQAEDELRKHRDSLEELIAERTDDLRTVNRELEEEIAVRKKMEARQRQILAKLQSANKDLGDFAHIVSHDLKAPLRGIKTLIEWIMADYADKIDDQGRQQMGLLTNRVYRMYNLIEGILQYSRVGRIKEDLAVVNLNEAVAEVVDLIAPPDNISITTDNELPTITCEPTRIGQVFQNLLSNAVKYMDKPQGKIRIACIEEDDYWKFSVADNGPGIEERYFERIFQMFQTLSSRDEFESTGVGLTVVKKIVEMYGGKIWVESVPGEGSTFLFTIPKQETEAIDAQRQTYTAC